MPREPISEPPTWMRGFLPACLRPPCPPSPGGRRGCPCPPPSSSSSSSPAPQERLAKATLMSQLYDILTVYDSDGGNSLQKHEFDLFMRNVEVKEVLQNFEVDYTGFLTLVEVLYEAGDLERVDTLESDENSGKHSRQSNHSIMTEVIREPALSFDEILDLVVRLKGGHLHSCRAG
ncbi:unnamed protein product [Prorocentrum cordatum]|uniref:Calmodulin n=1 Tax=Prorocentrum cordatum TaxID=2364126 RepID=A0ABN9VYX3_9DINO|nr:unnamed protein product [Polarella glacialis]